MGTRNTNAVFGILKNRGQIEMAVDELKENFFRSSDISILLPYESNSKNFVYSKATKSLEDASAGAIGGSFIDNPLSWLSGVCLITVPGIGYLAAAGPIASAVVVAETDGPLSALNTALKALKIPEYEAKNYENFIKNGKALMSIHVDSQEWFRKAKDLLDSYSASHMCLVVDDYENEILWETPNSENYYAPFLA